MDIVLTQISPASAALLASYRGIVKFDQKVVATATQDVLNSLRFIEQCFFKTTGFLVGNSLSIADLILFTTLVPLFTSSISFKKLGAAPKIKALLETLASDPKATKYTGKIAWIVNPFSAPKEEN
jgi:glutathione S-transferase